MYDELIAALRCCESTTNIVDECEREYCGYNCELPTCIDKMLRDAADAIEKLQTIISLYKKATGIEIDCDLVPLKEWEKRMKDGVL